MIGEVSGTRDGAPWPGIGREIDLSPDEAVPLIQARMAVPAVDPEREVQTAVVSSAPVEDRISDEPPEHTDPSVVVSNEARADQRAALVKGNRKKVNPDVA